jgi:hypothetical protein
MYNYSLNVKKEEEEEDDNGGDSEGGGRGGNIYIRALTYTHTPPTFIAEFTVSVEYDYLQPQYISWHTCVLNM